MTLVNTQTTFFHPFLIEFPVLQEIKALVLELGTDVNYVEKENGFELEFRNDLNGTPNRANLRVFTPLPNKCALFFHKKSLIPYSRDRFAYGAVVIDGRSGARFDRDEVLSWIQFLTSGFSPSSRPQSLKKSIPFTVPED